MPRGSHSMPPRLRSSHLCVPCSPLRLNLIPPTVVAAIAYPKLAEQSEMFATASADGTLRVWDVNTYTVLAKGTCQTATTGKPSCIDFTGEAIFSGWADGKSARPSELAIDAWFAP